MHIYLRAQTRKKRKTSMEDHAHPCGISDSISCRALQWFPKPDFHSLTDSSAGLTENALQLLSVCRHPAWESAARTVNVCQRPEKLSLQASLTLFPLDFASPCRIRTSSSVSWQDDCCEVSLGC